MTTVLSYFVRSLTSLPARVVLLALNKDVSVHTLLIHGEDTCQW